MKLVLDIETQNSFQDIGGKANLNLLKISVVGVYWYPENRYYAFSIEELPALAKLLNQAELIIGYNLKGFDYLVLQNYLKDINFSRLKTLDILEEIDRYLGYKIKLQDVAQGTLGTGKSGTGLDAVKMWQDNNLEDLKKYCLKDVEVTKNVYEYGVKNKLIKFKGLWQTYEVPVEWY